ncbi:hypothetical protein P692DRAFT_201852643 [Suillus brevipes Sb2]|nr:hypothetical protein P692DRAFT_201852643 [Suillus brevipes Sb2]
MNSQRIDTTPARKDCRKFAGHPVTGEHNSTLTLAYVKCILKDVLTGKGDIDLTKFKPVARLGERINPTWSCRTARIGVTLPRNELDESFIQRGPDIKYHLTVRSRSAFDDLKQIRFIQRAAQPRQALVFYNPGSLRLASQPFPSLHSIPPPTPPTPSWMYGQKIDTTPAGKD